MVSKNLIYAKFLDYLENCQGCVGKRDQSNCRYAVTCATVEVLSKKGLVRNSEELLGYGCNHDGRGK